MKKLLLFLLLASLPVMAQTDRGTLTGTITDPSGRRIAGAELAITSFRTGLETFVSTNKSGVYSAPSLETGTYQVSIEAQGFTTLRFNNVALDVGQIRTLDARLSVAGGVTEINVQPDSGLSRSSGEIGGVVHGQQATDLPINGRSFTGLISLIPGAIDSGTGQMQDVRFAGLSDEDNVWHLDGVDNSGINNSFVDVNMRLLVSTEAIAEFRANSVAYSADQGGAPGGQIEVSSKTGGDKFTGAAWEFIRNSIFDASPWDSAGQLPALKYNDFGANLGGPILKKKLFFFVNYEGLRQDINQVLSGFVPSTSFRAEVAADQPILAPLIDAFPLGQVPYSAEVTRWFGSGPQVTQENSGLARADWHINDKMSAFARFNTDAFTQSKPDHINPLTGFHNESEPSAVIGLQNTFSPTFLNDFRYGFNRTVSLEGQTTPLPFLLSISPFVTLDTSSGTTRNDNTFSFIDDATFQHGRHTIKAGITFLAMQENKASPNSPDWELTYNSTQDFLNNAIDSDYYRGANPLTGARMKETYLYVLDQFKASQTLNMNVGLRYEYFGQDHEVQGRGVSVDPLHCPDVICPKSVPWYYPNLLDFSPRISVAWAPEALHGKTAIRAGFGIYYGNGQFGSLGDPIGNISTDYTLYNVSYPVYPDSGVGQSSNSPTGADIHRKDTASNEWTLSIQQQVARQTIFQAAYFGTAVEHVFNDTAINGVNPVTGLLPYPGFAPGFEYKEFTNHASTNAFQASLQRNFSTGLLLSLNYEFSHSINNGGIGGGESDTPQNINCLRCERASSDQDMRHYFTASSVWQLPIGRGHAFLGGVSRFTNTFIGGWQLSTILSARSGLPLNVTVNRDTSDLPDQLNQNQRPDRVPGVPLYPRHKTTDLWLNPAAFALPQTGTWGNLGRNAVRAPGVWQIDPSLSKHFPLADQIGLTFRAEAFNVFNGAQYGQPNTNWAPGADNPNGYGLISSSYNTSPTGTGTPRELQFGLKLEF
ncbi:TonB-dependent receptor [Paracidobacterium acidisoli]|uniref:TonB-dependent receptor n=1 Tax=Paracidobacterium acidisoli TaxID=2303751 RepID=A0A372IS19_9BACT|nr:carboxypeptidase-like regulatory domain-containing protein [Paracidobacterium acidisoli]MBT9330618.1 carboxypeptidase-like regulatory domain-containing protein [Paracidobacterium acidisoli]